MKAVVITRFGGPEVLEIQDVLKPQPGPEEVLVQVRSTALNRADLLQRLGLYAAPPGAPQNILGLEFAGEVVELGANVHGWHKGDRVMGIVGGGAHAQFMTAHQDVTSPCPRTSTGLPQALSLRSSSPHMTPFDKQDLKLEKRS